MIQFGVNIQVRLVVAADGVALPATEARGRAAEHLDSVMGELLTLERARGDVSDPAISFDAGERSARFELVVAADSPGMAVDVADSVVRAAIHAAGGFTPGWDHPDVAEPGVIEYDLVEVHAQRA